MRIQYFRNKHRGERCYILGNGPSLNEVDLGSLDGTTFGTNRIYLAGFVPDYYTCVNPLVLDQFWEEIREYISTPKFLPAGLDFPDYGDVVEIDTSLNFPHFEEYPEKSPMWEGHTVTYVALQLAFYMGFEEVILLGVDHDYGEVKRPNLEVIATGPDEHHFHPEYFTGGVRWNYPDLRMSELAYSLAKAAYERDGRRIYNESASTKLDIFPLRKHLQPKRTWYPRVSAIVSAYKAQDYIEGCLEDLRFQNEFNLNRLEIVVVCQEGSEEHKQAELFKDSVRPHQIIIVTTEDIPTVYHAWNLGIKAATGRYITNANADDRRHPRSMEICADILDARLDIDLVYHDQYITWEPNQTFAGFLRENHGKELKGGRWEGEPGFFSWLEYDKIKLSDGCFVGPQPMWRVTLHQRHGYFIDEWKSAGDYEFWLRIAGDKNFLHIPVSLGLYLARPDGIELSSPIESQQESTNAIFMHQYPEGFEMVPSGDFVKMIAGSEYQFVQKGMFVDGVRKFLEQLEGE